MYSTPESPIVKHCAACGTEFTPSPSKARTQRFCSASCRFAYYCDAARKNPQGSRSKICECCGREYAPNKLTAWKQRFCSEKCRLAIAIARPSPYWYTCEHCGKQYQAKKKDRKRFCSRECSIAWLGANGRHERMVECSCVVCGAKVVGRINLLSDKYCSEACRNTIWTTVCKVCGDTFDASSNAKTCGNPACSRKYQARRVYESNCDKHSRTIKDCACKNYGEIFKPEYGCKRRLFCCDKCATQWVRKQHPSKSLNVRARRVLRIKYGDAWTEHYESINAHKVFQRDGWRCKLCGSKIRRTKKFEARQATVDHIVPLSKGGDHTYVNVQAACQECNVRKSATTKGQMRLFG